MKKMILTLAVCQMFSVTTFAAETSTTPDNSVATIGDMNSKDDSSVTQTTTSSSAINGGQLLGSEVMSQGNSIVNQGIQNMTKGKDAPDWLKRTDISVEFQNDFKPVYSIETVQPISEVGKVTNFTQFRLGNDLGSDEGDTINLGFGRRYLSNDKTSLIGVNTFYDYSTKWGHARVGGGLEYFKGLNEYRANVYHAVSGEKEIDVVNDIFEKALSGYDYEAGTSFKSAPWAKVFLEGFHWDYTYASDINGYKVRTELQVTRQLNLEMGYVHENGNVDITNGSGSYAKLMYTLGDSGKPAMFETGKKVFRSGDVVTVEDKRLQKVERENEIKVETYQKVSTSTGTVSISISRS